MDDAHRAELEASASLGETSLWIEALAEEADLNTEVDRFLANSSQAVPLLTSSQRREDGS